MPFRKRSLTAATGGSITFQPDLGTSPVVDSSTGTLTLTSSDASITITGNSATDTLDLKSVGGGGAPTNATYVTLSTDATLTNERVLTGTANQITITDGGAGSTVTLSTPQNIHTAATPTFASLTLSGLTQGSVIFAGSGGLISQDNTNLFFDDTNNTLIAGDPGTESASINLNGTSYVSRLKVSDIGGTTPAQFIIHRHSLTLPAAIVAARAKSDTSAHGVLASADELFFLSASGWTGTHYDTFGIISFVVDTGTVSSTSSPGRINFWTAPDGSDSPAIAMSIRSTKSVEMPGYTTGISHFDASGVITSSLIVNADVSASAAIAVTKLANGTANQLLGTNAAANSNEFKTLSGTSNQITVTHGVGTITLATPQDIAAASSPTFTGLTLSGLGLGIVHSSAGGALSSSLIVNADVSASAAIARSKLASGTANRILVNDGTGVMSEASALTNGQLLIGSTGAAPVAATITGGTNITVTNGAGSITIGETTASAPASAAFVTIGNTASLSAERALTGTSNQVTITDNGANSTVVLSLPQNIHTGASPTFTGLTLSGLTSTGVLYNQSGVVTTEAVFNYDQTNNILFVPGISGGTTNTDNLSVYANSTAYVDNTTGSILLKHRMKFAENFTAVGSGGALNERFIDLTSTVTSSLIINIFTGYTHRPQVKVSVAQILSSAPAFQAAPTFTHTVAGLSDTLTYYAGFDSVPNIDTSVATGTSTLGYLYGYNARPKISKTGAATMVAPLVVGFTTFSSPLIGVTDWASGPTVTEYNGFRCYEPVASGCNVTNYYGFKYITPVTANKPTITNEFAFASDMATAATSWNIYCTGTGQSSHKGMFKFGDNVAPTALVHMIGSTTAASSMRIEAGTAPTTPNSGDIWHDSTRQALLARIAGMTLGITEVGFTATAAATVASSVTETTIAGTGTGTLTLAANFLTVAKTIRVRAWGVYGTKAPAVGTFTLKFKYGSTALITVTPTLTGSLTNQMWDVAAEFTCRTTGATGTVFPQMRANFMTSTTAEGVIVAGPTATTTIATTASSKVDLTVQWGTSNASNTITCNNFTMEVLY